MRSSVDLPQPDGPTSTMNSPSSMSKLMPWMTFVAPKDFSMFWNETEAIFRYQRSEVRIRGVVAARLAVGAHRARVQTSVMISRRRR